MVDVSERKTSVHVTGGTMRGRDAAVIGWEALRAVFHSRGARSREALAEWIHSQAFPMSRRGAHFSASKRSFSTSLSRTDARVFENLFVQLTLEQCRGLAPSVPTSRLGSTNNDTFPDRCWEVVDSVDLGAMFEQRLSFSHERKVSSSSATCSRGTISHTRLEVVLHGARDVDVTPNRSCATGSTCPFLVSGPHCGRKRQLQSGVVQNFLWQAPRQTRSEPQWPARRVQMGEVTRARQCLTGVPGNDATLQELQLRRPQEVSERHPKGSVGEPSGRSGSTGPENFHEQSEECPEGSSPGPGGWTYEHMRELLDVLTHSICSSKQPPVSHKLHSRVNLLRF